MDNVHRIMASQGDLKTACDTIEAYQNELDNDLASLAENLDLELEALQLQVRRVCVCLCGFTCTRIVHVRVFCILGEIYAHIYFYRHSFLYCRLV